MAGTPAGHDRFLPGAYGADGAGLGGWCRGLASAGERRPTDAREAHIAASEQLFDRARAVIPGGVSSPVRAYGSVGGTPPFIIAGDGAHVVDEDGNRYVDLVQSWGPLPLGHAHPQVLAAARAALERGSSFGAPTRGEVVLAELLVEAIDSVDKVRLVNSGTEAAMTAVRLARGATGRDKILKFRGHYHGHSDALLADAGSGAATLSIPSSPGVPAGATADTLLVPWNDPEAVRAAIDAHGDGLAAIICEPVAANMSLVPPREGFLDRLRDEADRCGALLVFDEVITGFRLGRGGAQARHGVAADLTVLGKAIGGGFPLAAVAGRAEVMDELAPVGEVYQAGTLSGNPVAVAAGTAQVRLLTEAAFTRLETLAERLAEGLSEVLRGAGEDVVVRRHGSLVALLFTDRQPWDREDVEAADHDRYGAFLHAMLRRGVYLAPSGYEVMFPCTALTDEDLDHVLQAAGGAADELSSGSAMGPSDGRAG